MYYIIIIALLILDQITKFAIVRNMELNQSVPIIDNLIHFTHTRNYGAAFSSMQNKQMFLIIITTVVMLILLYFLTKHRKDYHFSILLSFSLIIGGGLGNLCDRIRLGYVVDFIDFRFFPVFNVADMAVVCGCGLFMLYLLVIEPKLSKV